MDSSTIDIYADDTQLYFYCDPSQIADLKQRVLLCIERISAWMASYRLKLNPSKIEFIWCTTLRRRRLIGDSTVVLGDTEVRTADTIRNLAMESNSTIV